LVLASTGVPLLCWFCPRLLRVAGMGPINHWFLDTHTVLGAIEANGKGLDAYSYNKISEPHWYSHWWFGLDWAHLTQEDTRWAGPLVSISAFVVAWIVTRPRNALELRWALLVLCSPPLILGFYRANVDLLLFSLLALVVPAMLARPRFLRILGPPALIALAAGLKYYPATAGLVLLAVRPLRDRIPALLAAAGLLFLTAVSVAPDLIHYTNNAPISGFYTFGAPTLFVAAGLPPAAGPGLTLGFLVLAGWALLQRSGLRTWSPPAELRTDYLGFILGAVILTGCFVTTVNYAYRWIFLVGMIPFLCRLDVARTHPELHHLQVATRLLSAFALWSEVPIVTMLNHFEPTQEVANRWQDWSTGFTQIVTWSLFACLSGWLAHFMASQWQGLPGGTLSRTQTDEAVMRAETG